jgi:adenylosuccinate lyase
MESVWSDKRKFQSWLDTEIAILEAKEELGQIPTGTALKTKQNAKFTVEAIEEREKETRHDLMAFVQVVSESLPPEIRPYFHAGVTSYDIEDTALATQIRDSTDLIEIELSELSQTLKEMAQKYKYTLEIGRTHGVHAEPITFGLKLLNWYAEVERHRKKLMENRPYFLVGKISGAVGTYANIDPRIEQIVCKKLGIYPADISTQIVSRDYHSLYLFLLASIAASLEKFATEIRNLHRTEIREVQEPSSEKQTGSSAMPHKKALPNPISSENVSSLSRLIKGYLIVALENQALCWHERTLDNSANERIIFADASTYIHYLLWRFINVLKNLKINPERMQENLNLTRGIIFSEDVMLALAEKGMSREDAHALLQELTLRSLEQGLEFKEVLLADPRITNILSKEEIDNCLDPQRHLKNIDQIFARFGL